MNFLEIMGVVLCSMIALGGIFLVVVTGYHYWFVRHGWHEPEESDG